MNTYKDYVKWPADKLASALVSWIEAYNKQDADLAALRGELAKKDLAYKLADGEAQAAALVIEGHDEAVLATHVINEQGIARLRARADSLARENAELKAALEAGQAKLPEGMKDCIILFKECALGHGWLTAKNWVQHDCPTCREAALENAYAAAQALLDRNTKPGYPCQEDTGECYYCDTGIPRPDGWTDEVDHLEKPEGHKPDCAWKEARDFLNKMDYKALPSAEPAPQLCPHCDYVTGGAHDAFCSWKPAPKPDQEKP